MKVLRYGDEGPIVELLQLALNRAGFQSGDIDGIFGRRTFNAVENFQSENGLSRDGVVGKLTWAALYPYLSGYTLHVVAQGDTLYNIAAHHGASLQSVITANVGVVPENLQIGQQIVVPLPFAVVSGDVNYSSAYVTIILDGLCARYPFMSVRQFGTSVMGRQMLVATVGEGDKRVGFNASHHANEWITTPLNLMFLETYLRAIAFEEEIYGFDTRELFESTTLDMVPLVNPDGMDLVTGAIEPSDSYYQQAKALAGFYPDIPFPDGWKANIRGVDLNLGYPAGWEEARRIKFAQGYTRPGPRDFVGTAPLNEPENIAMADLTIAGDYALTVSYHTQGAEIYWKFLDFDPPRAEEIGQQMAQSSGYALVDTPYSSGFAGYKDWFIQSYNRPGYTIEAGKGVNPLPLSDLSKLFEDNIGIFVIGLYLS